VESHVLFGLDPLWVSTAILAATYITIVTERVNRAIVAGIGASFMIIFRVLNQDQAIRGVDFNTIMLLAGMMLIVGVTRRTGVFEYLAIWSAKKVGARPAAILVALALATALFSALLDNVTTVLLMVPVTIAIAKELKVPAYPFLVTEVLASNVGGTATLIGDPPNIMIGSAAGLTFNDFVLNLAPAILVILAVNAVLMHFVWGRRANATEADRQRVLQMNERELIKDAVLLRHCLSVLAVCAGARHRAGAWHDRHDRRSHIDSDRQLASSSRAPDAQGPRQLQRYRMDHAVLLHGPVHRSGGRGARRRNRLRRPLGPQRHGWKARGCRNGPQLAGGHENVTVLWWALALGACLGGNGTLVGASANLTVAGLSERQGVPFRFLTYLKVGFPVMLLSIVIAQIYMYLRYL
jgi:Na+/H+ antiporter NhaD/arsenite permease-like protein